MDDSRSCRDSVGQGPTRVDSGGSIAQWHHFLAGGQAAFLFVGRWSKVEVIVGVAPTVPWRDKRVLHRESGSLLVHPQTALTSSRFTIRQSVLRSDLVPLFPGDRLDLSGESANALCCGCDHGLQCDHATLALTWALLMNVGLTIKHLPHNLHLIDFLSMGLCTMNGIKNVAIIGAGPCGLAAAK